MYGFVTLHVVQHLEPSKLQFQYSTDQKTVTSLKVLSFKRKRKKKKEQMEPPLH